MCIIISEKGKYISLIKIQLEIVAQEISLWMSGVCLCKKLKIVFSNFICCQLQNPIIPKPIWREHTTAAWCLRNFPINSPSCGKNVVSLPTAKGGDCVTAAEKDQSSFLNQYPYTLPPLSSFLRLALFSFWILTLWLFTCRIVHPQLCYTDWPIFTVRWIK
jgi:hypothetical protein